MKYFVNRSFYINRKQFVQETNKELDGNNFLVAYDVPIAKTGIQQYSREELGDKNGHPDELLNVYRPPETFEDEELLKSFDGIPIVYRHPDNGKVDNQNFKEFVVGTVSGVYYKSGNLFARKLTIIDKEAITNVLKKNTNELSIGFRGQVTKEVGKFNGVPYQYRETVIHANHLALCEAGKAGSYYAINSKKKGNNMFQTNSVKEEHDRMKDCMDSLDGKEHDIHALVEQVVHKKLAQVRPKDFGDGHEHHMENEEDEDGDEPETKHAMKKEKVAEHHLEKKHAMDDSTDPELIKSEHHDKDIINSLKRTNKKLQSFINQKNKEIEKLELANLNLEEALIESREYLKNMATKLRSSNLVKSMTGPDDLASPTHPKQVDFCNSITSSFLYIK